jgi:hypothetical protein
MIKYEANMLVLDPSHSKDDQAALNLFVENVQHLERQRILKGIKKLEDQSHATKTPLYQETMFAKIREIVNLS